MFTVNCSIKYSADPAVRSATKGIAVTQVDGLATKTPIGPAQLITIDKIDQPNPISLSGVGMAYVRCDTIDTTGAIASGAPFYGAVNVGLPPVTGFSLNLPGQWS